MNHDYSNPTSSISREFFSFGPEALAVNRAYERRASEMRQQRFTDAHTTRRTSWFRRWLGSMMISTGTRLAGKAATTARQSSPRLATSR